MTHESENQKTYMASDYTQPDKRLSLSLLQKLSMSVVSVFGIAVRLQS